MTMSAPSLLLVTVPVFALMAMLGIVLFTRGRIYSVKPIRLFPRIGVGAWRTAPQVYVAVALASPVLVAPSRRGALLCRIRNRVCRVVSPVPNLRRCTRWPSASSPYVSLGGRGTCSGRLPCMESLLLCLCVGATLTQDFRTWQGISLPSLG